MVFIGHHDASNTLIASGVVVSLVVGAYSFRKVWNDCRSKPPRPWPFLPGWLPLIGHVHLTGSVKDIVEKCERWADQYASDGCYEMQIFGRRFIMISNEARALEILQHRPFIVVRPVQINSASRSIGAKFLLEAEGEEWKQEHRLVAPALNKANVNDYLSIFRTMSERLVLKWSMAADEKKAVNILPDLSNLSADTIAKVSMDKDFDFLGSESQAGQDVKSLLRGFVSRSMAPFEYWNIPVIGQFLDGLGWSINRTAALVEQVLFSHFDEPQAGDAIKTTFLHKVFTMMHSKKETIPRYRLVGNVVGLFLAGTDTTSKAILAALYFLADDTHLQKMWQKEADEVDLESLSLQELYTAVPRIKSLLHEVHRWYGTPSKSSSASRSPAAKLNPATKTERDSSLCFFSSWHVDDARYFILWNDSAKRIGRHDTKSTRVMAIQ